jgi:hypothetical protein
MTASTQGDSIDRRQLGPAGLPIRDVTFLDTECTGLDLDADIWEFAAVRLRADGSRHELHMFIAHDPAKATALPEPFRTDYATRCPKDIAELVPQDEAVARITAFVGINSVVVGATPAYDSQRLAVLFGRYCRRAPSWINTMIDVCALAVGHLWASGQRVDFPLYADRLGHQLGVFASDFRRHTAMGDVVFVETIFKRCMQFDTMPRDEPSGGFAAIAAIA